MKCPTKYSISDYEVPEGFLLKASQLQPFKSSVALAINWSLLILGITALIHWLPRSYFWYAYVPAIFLIASRYGVFLQLIHEGSHHLLSGSKVTNHFIATFLCSLPIGIQFDGYTRGHVRHHAFTNTDKDPKSDTEKYRIVDFCNPRLYLLFLKDLLGITAISIFFQYDEFDTEADKAQGASSKFRKIGKFLQLCFVQLIIFVGLFQFSLFYYVFLWLIPAVSPHMFLMRVRGIAEHGLAKQMGVKDFDERGVTGNFYTRSFLTPENRYSFPPFGWLEKMMIGSLSVYYHHEHHLVPYVPHYNLKELHQVIAHQVIRVNPEVYAKGYVAAATRKMESLNTLPLRGTSRSHPVIET